MSAAGGTIYYTINQADPRLPGTGEAAPDALIYNGPISLSGETRIKARVKQGSEWSALNEAAYQGGQLEPPRIDHIRRQGNALLLVFKAAPGRSYLIEFRGHASAGAWEKLLKIEA
jgi:hypothetical protein